MIRSVELRVEINTEDWVSDDSIFMPDGALEGMVELRLGGRSIFGRYPLGLNNSAVSLVRSALADHKGTDEAGSETAPWPLFFCDGRIPNSCGVVKDFSVTHRGEYVEFSDFFGCLIPSTELLQVRWASWAKAVASFGASVRRRLPLTKRGMKEEVRPLYRQFRTALGDDLKALRRTMRQRGA